jgi:hypothetical protein
MNSENTNCPHCGAEKRPVCKDMHHYECGSNRFCNYRSPYCREREARQKAWAENRNLHDLLKKYCKSASRAQVMQSLREEYSELLSKLTK